MAGADGVAFDGQHGAVGVDQVLEPGGAVSGAGALDHANAGCAEGVGHRLQPLGLGLLVAQALSDVVKLAAAGGRDQRLDGLGVALELGDRGGLGEVEEVVAVGGGGGQA